MSTIVILHNTVYNDQQRLKIQEEDIIVLKTKNIPVFSVYRVGSIHTGISINTGYPTLISITPYSSQLQTFKSRDSCLPLSCDRGDRPYYDPNSLEQDPLKLYKYLLFTSNNSNISIYQHTGTCVIN